MTSSPTQKLQKVLAASGLGSRRAMETWILEGRVSVNGTPATLGQRVTEKDVITLDDKPVLSPLSNTSPAILMYHKPRGEVCTRDDPEKRPTVFDHLPDPPSGRWVMVGRLDVNTSGLLLFTNDGELANRLMHPRFHLEREYHVRVYGKVTKEILKRLKEGVELEDGVAKFDKITLLNHHDARNSWFAVTINIGRNRIVRRLWESQGLKVNRLERVRFGSVVLPQSLKPGEFKKLSAIEISRLSL